MQFTICDFIPSTDQDCPWKFNAADNLLLTAHQKSVKLADFGLAREETVTEMMTAETGTYRWMAPEVNLFHVFEYFHLF